MVQLKLLLLNIIKAIGDMSFLSGILSSIFKGLFDHLFGDREKKQLQEEKLKGKDDAIKFKTKEASTMSEPVRTKSDILDELRKHTKD